MSVYCDWVRWKVWSATFISVWQHVKLSEQICPWDTLACCWDVQQPTNSILFWGLSLSVSSWILSTHMLDNSGRRLFDSTAKAVPFLILVCVCGFFLGFWGFFLLPFICCLLLAQRPSNVQSVSGGQILVRAATLRWKVQLKHAVSHSQGMLTPCQPAWSPYDFRCLARSSLEYQCLSHKEDGLHLERLAQDGDAWRPVVGSVCSSRVQRQWCWWWWYGLTRENPHVLSLFIILSLSLSLSLSLF